MPRPAHLITVVFFGDSITEGQYVAPPNRWVDIVSSSLLLRYRDDPVNLLLLPRGVSGETTRQALERFPRDVQAQAPDVLTIQFGLNDCNCWPSDHGLPRVSEAAYRANLTEMIDRARRFGAEEIILSNNHTTLRHKPLLDGSTLEQRRARYNKIAAEVACQTNVTFCDVDSGYSSLAPPALNDQLLPYPDLLHLSDAGHRTYAALIGPCVERAVERVLSRRGL